MDLVRYRSTEEDSARWRGFPFRPDDIVISTRSKSGTTWVQMICALLVLQTPELPERLDHLSPWLDWLVDPADEVIARLEAQQHRRFIKTHTPLDGLPQPPGITYVVIGRHPLDMAVSLYHQGDNIDRDRLAALTGSTIPPPQERPPMKEWVRDWIEWDGSPREDLDSLPGVMHHLTDAWRRRDQSHIVLLHYGDLEDDLEGEMRRLGGRLGIAVPADRWPVLVEAATFEAMRQRVRRVAPSRVLRSPAAFFRRGSSGAGSEALGAGGVAAYRRRAAQLAPAEMLTWLHRES